MSDTLGCKHTVRVLPVIFMGDFGLLGTEIVIQKVHYSFTHQNHQYLHEYDLLFASLCISVICVTW